MKKKIMIGTPCYNAEVSIDYAHAMARNIAVWREKYDVNWIVIKRTFICKARHAIAQAALDWGADYIFWIDDDALVRAEHLDQMMAHDKDIVIAPYPIRVPPFSCGVLKSTTGEFNNQSTYRNLKWEDMKQGLLEIDGGGTHCMLTKAHIYGPPMDTREQPLSEYMEKRPGQVPYPWFVLAPLGGTEDMWFCLKARNVGVKIYCDSDIEAPHLGYPEIITGEHGRLWQSKFGEKGLDEILVQTGESTFIGALNADVSSQKPLSLQEVDTATAKAVDLGGVALSLNGSHSEAESSTSLGNSNAPVEPNA